MFKKLSRYMKKKPKYLEIKPIISEMKITLLGLRAEEKINELETQKQK